MVGGDAQITLLVRHIEHYAECGVTALRPELRRRSPAPGRGEHQAWRRSAPYLPVVGCLTDLLDPTRDVLRCCVGVIEDAVAHPVECIWVVVAVGSQPAGDVSEDR